MLSLSFRTSICPEYRRTCWTLWKKQATCSSSLPDPESKVAVDLLLIEMPPERCQRRTSFGEISSLSSFSSVFRVVSEESSNQQSFVRGIQLETYSRGPPPSFRLSWDLQCPTSQHGVQGKGRSPGDDLKCCKSHNFGIAQVEPWKSTSPELTAKNWCKS